MAAGRGSFPPAGFSRSCSATADFNRVPSIRLHSVFVTTVLPEFLFDDFPLFSALDNGFEIAEGVRVLTLEI